MPWSQELFKEFFETFGQVHSVYLGGQCGNNSSDQWGKVSYLDKAQALKALEANGVQGHT